MEVLSKLDLNNPREWRRLAPSEWTAREDIVEAGGERIRVLGGGLMVRDRVGYRRVRLTPDGEHRYLDIRESLDQPGVEMDANDNPEDRRWEPEQRRFHHRTAACADQFRVPLPVTDGNSTALEGVRGIGKSAPVPVVLGDDPCGDDVARDLTAEELRALRARGVR